MMRIHLIITSYPAPIDGEDYCPDGTSDVDTVHVTFRELVELMRDYSHTSSYPCYGCTSDYLTWQDSNTKTGELYEYSLHYDYKNDPRYAKYWSKALRVAGFC